MALKAVATEEVTLGLAEPVLGNNAKAKEIFGFLQSKTFSKDREGFIMGDVFADGVVRSPLPLYQVSFASILSLF
jgi:hypothetical protein